MNSSAPGDPMTWIGQFGPLVLGLVLIGAAALSLGVAWHIAAGALPGDPAVWNVTAGVFVVMAAVSTQWWPAALTPGWYRDWVHRGGNEQTDPWHSVPAPDQGHR